MPTGISRGGNIGALFDRACELFVSQFGDCNDARARMRWDTFSELCDQMLNTPRLRGFCRGNTVLWELSNRKKLHVVATKTVDVLPGLPSLPDNAAYVRGTDVECIIDLGFSRRDVCIHTGTGIYDFLAHKGIRRADCTERILQHEGSSRLQEVIAERADKADWNF